MSTAAAIDELLGSTITFPGTVGTAEYVPPTPRPPVAIPVPMSREVAVKLAVRRIQWQIRIDPDAHLKTYLLGAQNAPANSVARFCLGVAFWSLGRVAEAHEVVTSGLGTAPARRAAMLHLAAAMRAARRK